MPDQSKFARELASEIVALTRNTEPNRKRRIDWPTIIICVIAVAGVVWAIFIFCVKAEIAPFDKRTALIELSQEHILEKMTDGFSMLKGEIKELKKSTIGFTPRQNDKLEEEYRLKMNSID